jgi:hypothetical protein
VNDNIKTALITGGFMLAVIILNELAAIFRERRNRKKDFFNQFFAERIKVHEKIARAMTKDGIIYINPSEDSLVTVMKKVETLNSASFYVLSRGFLFADRYVYNAILKLSSQGRTVTDLRKNGGKLDPHSELAEAVAVFNDLYLKALGMLREKSGANLVEEIFESIPQRLGRKKKKNPKKRSGKDSQISSDK